MDRNSNRRQVDPLGLIVGMVFGAALVVSFGIGLLALSAHAWWGVLLATPSVIYAAWTLGQTDR